MSALPLPKNDGWVLLDKDMDFIGQWDNLPDEETIQESIREYRYRAHGPFRLYSIQSSQEWSYEDNDTSSILTRQDDPVKGPPLVAFGKRKVNVR